MAKRIVTLDIDNTSVRLLELDGNRVRRWGSTALEPGLVENGNVVNPELVGAHIRDLMASLRIRSGSVVSSIGGAFAISRVIMVPRTGGESLQRRVLRLAEEISPVPVAELYVTWRQLSTTDDDVEVLLLAVPRSVVNYHVAALQAAGLRATALNLKTIAVASLASEPDVLALNVGPSSVDIAVMVNGLPQVLHTATFPANGNAGQVDAAQVVSSLTRVVEFYNTRHPRQPLAADVPILLAGQEVMAPAFGEYLEEHTGRTVMLPEPPVEYPPHLSTAEYGVNIGLAVRRDGIDGHPEAGTPLSVNVLLAPQRQFNYSFQGVVIAVVVLLGLLGVLFLYQNLLDDQDTTAALKSNLQRGQTELQLQRATISRRGDLQRVINEFEQISSERGGITADWDLVEEYAGDTIQLKSIGFDGAGISLQVSADSLQAVEAYVESLRELDRFARVELPQETEEAGPRESVSLGISTTFAGN